MSVPEANRSARTITQVEEPLGLCRMIGRELESDRGHLSVALAGIAVDSVAFATAPSRDRDRAAPVGPDNRCGRRWSRSSLPRAGAGHDHARPCPATARRSPRPTGANPCHSLAGRSPEQAGGLFQQGPLPATLRSGKGLGHAREGADFRRWISDRLDHGLGTRGILHRKLRSQDSRTS